MRPLICWSLAQVFVFFLVRALLFLHQVYTLTSRSSLIGCQRARSLPPPGETLTSRSRLRPGVTRCALLSLFEATPWFSPSREERRSIWNSLNLGDVARAADASLYIQFVNLIRRQKCPGIRGHRAATPLRLVLF